MLFNYKAIDQTGHERIGSIEAINEDVAIGSLQRRGLVIASIVSAEKKSFFQTRITFFDKVSNKEMVIISRQIAILFESQVSASRVFKLLHAEVENPMLKSALFEIVNDIQSGNSISTALEGHPKIFSPFYINMVRAGEESGKLDDIFSYMADYLDRTYDTTTKARNAFIYPIFIIFVFILVMVLMLTFVIPKISAIFVDVGQELPIYTKAVVGASNIFIDYGLFLIILIIIGGVFLIRYYRTEEGKFSLSRTRMSIPYVGNLYKKLYLSRISDSLSTMLASGVTMLRAIEISADVVGDPMYKKLLKDSMFDVKSGIPVSDAFEKHEEMPNIMIQMIRVGEETGDLGRILKALSNFYTREVRNAVEGVVNLIEPAMIVMLAAGVGVLLAAVIMPIYNLSSAI